MLYTIKRRWFSSLPPIEVEIGAEYESAGEGVKLGAAVRVIVKKARADCKRADLTGAVLTGANLTGAVLIDADLIDADLTGADLTRADLSGADLTRADLSGADLTRAVNIPAAALRPIKADLFAILLANKREVAGLLAALEAGQIDGSVYEGDCACLVGTIAKVRGCPVGDLERDGSRPAERWFMGIKPGDTPENSEVAKITAGWIAEFQRLIAA